MLQQMATAAVFTRGTLRTLSAVAPFYPQRQALCHGTAHALKP